MSWDNGISSADARKEYFLTTDDLKTIPHQIPPYHRFGMGRATRYYQSTDLKDLADRVHGADGFAKKVADRKKRNEGKRKRDEEKQTESKKKKATKDTLVSKLPPVPRIADQPSLCAFVQGLAPHQVEQLFALLSDNHPDIIAKVESFKGTCRLERKSFADVEPKLAKMLDSLNPDVAFEKCKQKLDRAEAAKQRQIEENKRIAGKWQVEIHEPSNAGSGGDFLELELNGSDINGSMELNGMEYCVDIWDFAKGYSIESKNIVLKTDVYFCKKHFSGTLKLVLSKDESGHTILEGTYSTGMKAKDWWSTRQFKFIGSKENNDSSSEEEDDASEDENNN